MRGTRTGTGSPTATQNHEPPNPTPSSRETREVGPNQSPGGDPIPYPPERVSGREDGVPYLKSEPRSSPLSQTGRGTLSTEDVTCLIRTEVLPQSREEVHVPLNQRRRGSLRFHVSSTEPPSSQKVRKRFGHPKRKWGGHRFPSEISRTRRYCLLVSDLSIL